MMTLDDAWNWYVTTKNQLKLFGRFGRKYWDSLPWAGPLGTDETLHGLEGDVIDQNSRFGLEHLDDFAVLILFSVFESIVCDHVLSEVADERSRLRHTLLLQIVDGAIEEIESGSFFRVLEVFKHSKCPSR